MIRVLLADDQTLFRTMLTEILDKYSDIEVVAAVADGRQAIEQAVVTKPDIVLIDLDMPSKGGVEAAREIKQLLPDTRIAILTTFEDVGSVTAAANAGADAYLLKDIEPDILVIALKCLLKDLAVLHQSAFSILCPERENNIDAKGHYVFEGKSFDKTAVMIFRLLAKGYTNREIAQILHYSEGTVKNRISAMLAETGLPDRAALALFALRNQIV